MGSSLRSHSMLTECGGEREGERRRREVSGGIEGQRVTELSDERIFFLNKAKVLMTNAKYSQIGI